MSMGSPFDPLGRMLSEQGEIAIGLGIIKGIGRAAMGLIFQRKFGEVSPEDQQRVIDLAQSMVDAGGTITEMPLNALLRPEDIPLNEWLFGGDLQGRRVFVVGRVSIPGVGFDIEARLPFEDIPTPEEMRAAFVEEAMRRIRESPKAFGVIDPESLGAAGVFIQLPERAF